ncbi:hypothetical protein K3495_g748 [Podosphaera aphanis]|nr:hypothetical protein K3495_g748 [Podosphaera aphanis]
MFREERKKMPITRDWLINKALPPIAAPSTTEISPPSPLSPQSSIRRRGKRSMDTFKYYAHSHKDIFAKKSYLPPLIIPSNDDVTSPVKHPSQIETTTLANAQVSPTILAFLKPLEMSASSSPPSLDESLSSDRVGNMSDPPTPVIGNNETDKSPWSGGVQLQPAAMATLRALSGGDEIYRGTSEKLGEEKKSRSPKKPEMIQHRPPHIITNYLKKRISHESPKLPKPPESLMSIEIPSPGSFFSGLSPCIKETWRHEQASSTIATHFYRRSSDSPTMKINNEVIKTISRNSTQSSGLRGSINLPGRNVEILCSPKNVEPDPKIVRSDSTSTKKSHDKLDVNLDRTSFWVADQSLLLANSGNLTADMDSQANYLNRISSTEEQLLKASILKASEPFRAKPNINEQGDKVDISLSKIEESESTLFQAFQDSIARSSPMDVFVHRKSRMEALQSRLSRSPSLYHAQMLGTYQTNHLHPNSKNILAFNATAEDQMIYGDRKQPQNDEKHVALQQILPRIWNLMAVKYLNGGRLFIAPLERLLASSSSMKSANSISPQDQIQILDLGGQPICDWAWHCASEYPGAQVYSVTTEALYQENYLKKISGPKNHQSIMANRLIKLPFNDNQFDLISTRDFYTILKSHAEDGKDEWYDCLNECMRVLKPGGFLEFCIIDSDIATTGPLGTAKSEELSFNLNAHGYDPYPSQQWLRRLESAGFKDVSRSWLFLPLGGNQKLQKARKKSQSKPEIETGRSTENIASISGLVGTWAWEKWLSRYNAQNGGGDGALDGVYDIVEEGSRGSAGWRCITGWAKKI